MAPAYRGGRWRSACVVVLGVSATCCSLFTSLDGLVGDTTAPDGGPAAPRPSDGDAEPAPSPPSDGGSDPGTTDAAGDQGTAPSDATPPTTSAYRRTITVTNGASSSLPAGSLVRLDVDLAALVAAGKAKADGSDVVVGVAGHAIDRVLDPGGPIWFATAASIAAGGSDATYWIAYGGSGGAPPSDGKKVFALYDDFDGTTLSPTWQVQGAPTVSGGVVTFHHGSDQGITTIASSDGVPAASAVEIVARVTDPASNPDSSSGFYYWVGYQHTGDFTTSRPWIKWIARSQGSVQPEDNDNCSNCIGPAVPQSSAFRTYRIERAATGTRFYLDGALQYTAAPSNVDDLSVMMRNWCVTSDLVVDRVRAWAFVTPPPTASLGPEQPAP